MWYFPPNSVHISENLSNPQHPYGPYNTSNKDYTTCGKEVNQFSHSDGATNNEILGHVR